MLGFIHLIHETQSMSLSLASYNYVVLGIPKLKDVFLFGIKNVLLTYQ